ncbi:HAMP domain-containing histidine kinase [Paraglaciecola hydrolytica]|uniref:histidine kinase n=1 Tax=Paraglaciecola hydrolytica TaxID=1799789 RepID=A0A148KLG6_9ALTE|nr:HAMP domain-containing histidine kinase [Paraglaciecola hydrolytica]KXI27109.1 hypothetical protein AX660_01600 [Paraglaciecola hydrolytica]
MNISNKLFWSLLGLTSVILLATLSLARWSFERGFLDFISGQENQRLQLVAEELLVDYTSADNNWQNILFNGLEYYLNQHIGARPGRRPPPIGAQSPPSHFRGGDNTQRPPRLNNNAKSEIGPPTALFDHQGNWLAGDNQHQDQSNEIRVPLFLNNQLIGELRSWPRSNLDSPLASAFSRDQLWTSLLIGLICLVLASLMSWLLARLLLQPLKKVLSGVSQLSKGNYNLRFEHNRHDELGQLMDDVQHLSVTLDKNRTAKNRWLADISHELRTPLTVLSGEIDTLKAGLRPFNQQQLSSLEQETAVLRHLVDDLYELSLSDIGGLRYQFSRINLNDSLANSLNTLSQTIQNKGIDLTIESADALWLNADPRRIEQLLNNLLNNAINYTDAPGKIAIQLIHQQDCIVMLIDDTPPSASETECQFLFDPLYRQDSARTRRSSGAGLGLSICKNIVEAHQGSINAKPSKLGGLQIEVILPCGRES